MFVFFQIGACFCIGCSWAAAAFCFADEMDQGAGVVAAPCAAALADCRRSCKQAVGTRPVGSGLILMYGFARQGILQGPATGQRPERSGSRHIQAFTQQPPEDDRQLNGRF
jgi:hypothetical protein